MSLAVLRRFRMTVGRRIYALIGLSFLGLAGIGLLNSSELAAGLKQQKQIELQHLAQLALGIVKEEHAAAQKGDIAVARRRSAHWRGSPRFATATTIISGSTTCTRAW